MEHDIHQEQSRVLAPYGSYCRMPTWTALALVFCRVREARAVGHALYGLRVVWSVGWDALSLRRRCGYTSGKDQAPPPWKPFEHSLTNLTFSDTLPTPAQSRHAAYMSILYTAATALYEENAGLLLRMSSHHSQQLLCQTFLLHVSSRIPLTS